MAAISHSRVVAVAVVILLAPIAMPREARAQAWVPAKGEISFATVYQSQNVKKHLAATTPVAAGTDRYAASLMADFSYGLTDKMAVDVALPLRDVEVPRAPRLIPGTNIDDGSYRGDVFRRSIRGALQHHARPRSHHALRGLGHAEPRLRLLRARRSRPATERAPGGCRLPPSSSSREFRGCSCPAATRTASSRRSRISRTTAARPTSRWVTSSRRRFRAFAMTDGMYTHGNAIDFPQTGGMARASARSSGPFTTRFSRCTHCMSVAESAYSISDNSMSSGPSRAWSSAATATR